MLCLRDLAPARHESGKNLIVDLRWADAQRVQCSADVVGE
jgi:hypothetical protein